jgi:hypothetical protein
MEIKPYIKSLAEYVPSVLLFTAYGVVVGAVGGLFGYVMQFWNITQVEPWHWGLLFIAALVVAQFFVFHNARVARDLYAPDKVTHDWSMDQTLSHLQTDSAISATLDGHRGWALHYLSDLRQAARNGQVFVWGKMAISTGVSNSTIDLIEKDYWRTYQFDHEACFKLQGDYSRTEATFQGGVEIYDHLRFNSRQIKKLWKPKTKWTKIKRRIAHKVYPWLTA